MTARIKLLRTSTFRLAALYLILFAVSVSALLGYVYWNTAVLLERQTDDTIRAEVQALFADTLARFASPVTHIQGDWTRRFDVAVACIDHLLSA